MESGYFGVYNNYIKIVIIIDIPITIKFNSCVEVIMHFRTATAVHDNYLSLSRHSMPNLNGKLLFYKHSYIDRTVTMEFNYCMRSFVQFLTANVVQWNNIFLSRHYEILQALLC